MSGDPNIVWICLIAGILLQLAYMARPFEQWDGLRFLGSLLLPTVMLSHRILHSELPTPDEGLFACGAFVMMFAFLFEGRLLPTLREGVILMWTLVFVYVLLEAGVWRPAMPYLVGLAGAAILAMLLMPRLSYVPKIGMYAWFLFTIVFVGVLQFRRSDFSLMIAGRSNEVDYRAAFIDGMAGAYIAVHATFLYDLLPIPGKGEAWQDFQKRWLTYLDLVVSRVDNQRLRIPTAVSLIAGVVGLVTANHFIRFMAPRTLANLILVALPIGWNLVSGWHSGTAAPKSNPARRS